MLSRLGTLLEKSVLLPSSLTFPELSMGWLRNREYTYSAKYQSMDRGKKDGRERKRGQASSLATRLTPKPIHMSYSLNSLKGPYAGLYRGLP